MNSYGMQPYYGHQQYGQQLTRPYNLTTHNSLQNFSYPKFQEGVIVNYRKGQQDLCKKTCTPFLTKDVINQFPNPWITDRLYEIKGQDGKVRYVRKDQNGNEIGEKIYANEHTPINSSEENEENKRFFKGELNNAITKYEPYITGGGNGVFNLKRFLKIFKPKKPTKSTTPKKPTKPTTPKKPTKSTTPKKTTKSTTPKKTTKSTTPKKPTKSTTPKKPTKSTTPKKKSNI